MKYQISKSLLGRQVVRYSCPSCNQPLESKLDSAGDYDTCPMCRQMYLVPGAAELDELKVEKQKKDEEKNLQKELARQKAQERQNQRAHEQAMQVQRQRDVKQQIENIILTTTNHVDGYSVAKYCGIESVEFVLGTGFFSEITTSVEDFFGARSSAFEQKLQSAKQTALRRMKQIAYEMNGNAVIGIDLDYTEFSDNRIGLIVNGTIVLLVQKNGSETIIE